MKANFGAARADDFEPSALPRRSRAFASGRKKRFHDCGPWANPKNASSSRVPSCGTPGVRRSVQPAGSSGRRPVIVIDDGAIER